MNKFLIALVLLSNDWILYPSEFDAKSKEKSENKLRVSLFRSGATEENFKKISREILEGQDIPTVIWLGSKKLEVSAKLKQIIEEYKGLHISSHEKSSWLTICAKDNIMNNRDY